MIFSGAPCSVMNRAVASGAESPTVDRCRRATSASALSTGPVTRSTVLKPASRVVALGVGEVLAGELDVLDPRQLDRDVAELPGGRAAAAARPAAPPAAASATAGGQREASRPETAEPQEVAAAGRRGRCDAMGRAPQTRIDRVPAQTGRRQTVDLGDIFQPHVVLGLSGTFDSHRSFSVPDRQDRASVLRPPGRPGPAADYRAAARAAARSCRTEFGRMPALVVIHAGEVRAPPDPARRRVAGSASPSAGPFPRRQFDGARREHATSATARLRPFAPVSGTMCPRRRPGTTARPHRLFT